MARGKKIGETEQEFIVRRRAEGKGSEISPKSAPSAVTKGVGGPVIRTAEENAIFQERAKEFQGEDFRPDRAQQFQDLANPAAVREKARVAGLTTEELNAELGINPTQTKDLAGKNEALDAAERVRLSQEASGIIPDEVAKQVTLAGIAGKQAIAPTLKFTATAFDAIRTVFGKQPKAEQKAATALNEALEPLSEDMKNVKAGLVDKDDVLKNIQIAEESLLFLEETQKGLGKANVDYWIDEGLGIEISIKNTRDTLNRYKRDLLLLP